MKGCLAKPAFPRVRHSFLFSFETEKMSAKTVSLRNDFFAKPAYPRVRRSFSFLFETGGKI
jgi:hypothetical protein